MGGPLLEGSGLSGNPSEGSRAALIVLVTLVVLSPWAFGSVDPRPTQAIALVSLTTALLAVVWDTRRGTQEPAPIALWPIAGLWLLAVGQLVPLTESLHRAIAPGSAAVWHPDVPAAAAVLGSRPRPISLHPEATSRTLAFATGLVALALVAAPAWRDRRTLLRASIALVGGGVAVALYGLVARLVFTNKLYGVWSVPTVAPFGPFVNKNHFAGYVALTALLAVGLAAGLASEARRGPGFLGWIESSRARWVVVAWGAALILTLAVPVSLSRGGVVSLTAGLLAFAGMRLGSRRDSQLSPRALLAIAAGAVLLVIALVSALPTEARDRVLTLSGVTTEQSGSYRLAVWRDTLRLAGSSPWLGSGMGAFADALPRFKTAAGHLAVEHAESDYLEVAADGGLAAAALAFVLAAFVLARGLRGAASARERLLRGLVTGATAGLVALAVHSAFDFNLRIPSNALLAAALVAIVLAASPGSATRPSRLLVPAALAATLALGLFTSWSAPRVEPGPLTRAAHTAGSSLRRAELETETLTHLQRRPADPVAWLALAWVRLPGSPQEAASLAQWAVRLDPANAAVRTAALRLGIDRRELVGPPGRRLE
jgi:O-antigen ligase